MHSVYSAEQIRNKVYIPVGQENEFDLSDIQTLICIADIQGKRTINVRQDFVWSNTIDFVKDYGYKVEPVEFLGTKFWQISW